MGNRDMEFRFKTASEALPQLAQYIMKEGMEVHSRGDSRVMEITYPHIILETPWLREILTRHRGASLPAQIAETMWILGGRDDVAWLSRYLPRAPEFSDNGKTWRGGYGPRLRAWERRNDPHDVFDQLAYVVNLLKTEGMTRRAVINIYDPDVDSAPGKDIPCNNWLHFLNRKGQLDLHVVTRSNDLIWGWSGINAFEWSALQEIVAGLVGVTVGELHFSISSLHIYDRHWTKADKLTNEGLPIVQEPRFSAEAVGGTVDGLDKAIREWFALEERIHSVTTRKGGHGEPALTFLRQDIKAFPEPMMREWLEVIYAYWVNSVPQNVNPRLITAFLLSPSRKDPVTPPPAPAPTIPDDPFVRFVSDLHEEKHAAYGDSWKRRGEVLGIHANIARKIDRLGVSGAGDTTADTVIDLLCYLIKYRLWLYERVPNVEFSEMLLPASEPLSIHLGHSERPSDFAAPVTTILRNLSKTPTAIGLVAAREKLLATRFEELTVLETMEERIPVVEHMIVVANRVARRRFQMERAEASAAVSDPNATRFWQGYGEGEDA